MKKTILYLVFVFTSFNYLLAQNDSVQIRLQSIEIVSNKNQMYSDLGRIVKIIDRQEIDHSTANNMNQLLDNIAGIDIRQRGTDATQADISVRGGTFDQVLVLLNGVNITDPQTGHFNLDLPVSLSDIVRIEILEGSSARVLGPNSFSGAINIVTKSIAKRTLQAELSGGSFTTFGQNISGTTGNEKNNFFVSVTHKNSSGYRYNSDYEYTSTFARWNHTDLKTGNWMIQMGTQFKTMGENGFYSLKYPNQREDINTLLGSVDWSKKWNSIAIHAQLSTRPHYDKYKLDRFTPSGYNYHLTTTYNGKMDANYYSKFGKTSFSVLFRRENILSNRLGNQLINDSIKNIFEKTIYFKYKYFRTTYTSLFDHSIQKGKWYASAGIAWSYCQDFKSSIYGGIDAGYEYKKHEKVFISINSATRIPTFTDLFFSNPVLKGNIFLKPEKSTTFELGYKTNRTIWAANADVYYRWGNNIIDWVKLTNTSTTYQAMNLSEVNAFGGDINIEVHPISHIINKLTTSYSFLLLNKSVMGVDSKYALDYLRHKVNIHIEHCIIQNLSGSWDIAYHDRAGTYDSNTIVGKPSTIEHYHPYCVVDFRIMWNNKHWTIFANANNISNTKFADYGGILQPRINGEIGVRWKM